MRKAILASMLLVIALVAFGQHAKPEPSGKTASKSTSKPKPKPTPNSKWEQYTPCGVYYKDAADFIHDMDNGWQPIGKTGDTSVWYDSDTERCGNGGVLKVWIKMLHIDGKDSDNYALTEYELKCKTDELRDRSSTKYDKAGNVITQTDGNAQPWQDAIPESIGSMILKAVCRRPL